MPRLADHYDTLELPEDVDYKQARQHKNDLLLVWHPDKHQKNERVQKKAEQKTRDINEAWQAVETHLKRKKPKDSSDSRRSTSREKSDPRNGRTRSPAASGQRNLRTNKILPKVVASAAALLVAIMVSTNASWSTKESWKCHFGDADACWGLGLAYSVGVDVDQDLLRAAELYEKACAGGDTRGCNDLALIYGKGEGVVTDAARAAELYEQACTGGNDHGCFNLGVLYNRGDGVAKNQAAAKRYFAKACEMGNEEACRWK